MIARQMSIAAEDLESLPAELRQLCLSRRVWTGAIDRLTREKNELLQDPNELGAEVEFALRLRLLQIEHEIAVYEICLDRICETAEHQSGVQDPEIARRRERFYRLMRGLAKAGNELASISQRDTHLGCVIGEKGWSPDRWVAEMDAVATEARKDLLAAAFAEKLVPEACRKSQ